jgi:L-lysine exporter family protein LysE/ArgO
MFATAIAGLGFGLSLLVSIGPQNAYILRQGSVGRHITTVVMICLVSDVVLIAAGTAGAGALVQNHRSLLTVIRLAGAAFILSYAALASRRAWNVQQQLSAGNSGAGDREQANHPSLRAVVSTCLAFTWLNPWVYIDTMVLLGTVANTHIGKQWWFAGGAMSASVIWFLGLGFASRSLGPLLRRPRAGQVMDGLVAVLMVITAVRLLLA